MHIKLTILKGTVAYGDSPGFLQCYLYNLTTQNNDNLHNRICAFPRSSSSVDLNQVPSVSSVFPF